MIRVQMRITDDNGETLPRDGKTFGKRRHAEFPINALLSVSSKLLIPILDIPPPIDHETLGQFGLGIAVYPIAHGARASRRAAAACPRPIPRPVRVGLADPAAIVAACAKFHGSSEAHGRLRGSRTKTASFNG